MVNYNFDLLYAIGREQVTYVTAFGLFLFQFGQPVKNPFEWKACPYIIFKDLQPVCPLLLGFFTN